MSDERSMMVADFKTCEICGEESPNDGTGLWSSLVARWVHRGLCFHEFGLLSNAPSSIYRDSLETFGNKWRERAAWLRAEVKRFQAERDAAEARGAAAERERVRKLAEEVREADETARRTAFSAADLDELTIRADTLIGWDVALREFLRRLEEA